MIVVTDTSVVLNLCLLGHEDVLATLFQLDRLQTEARFWFSPSLRIQVLQLAGEIP